MDVVIEPYQQATSRAQCAVAEGQSVLWIRSTVTDAVTDFQAFDARGLNSMLHHSRYAAEDRKWLDRQLMRIFGPNGSRGGILAVTTQTAEQSLDIDADLLVTDACPADVLLQRIGRLHRHRTGTRPTVVVIDPGDLEQYLTKKGKVRGCSGQGWPWVYGNLLSVRATLDWLLSHGSISVPGDCRVLVERATHADYLRELAGSLDGYWVDLWRNLYDAAAIKSQLAEASVIDWGQPYRKALVDQWLPTRLGEGSVTVAVKNIASPFTGQRIEALPILLRWLPKDQPLDAVLPRKNGPPIEAANQRFRLGGAEFGYSRFGIQRLSD